MNSRNNLEEIIISYIHHEAPNLDEKKIKNLLEVDLKTQHILAEYQKLDKALKAIPTKQTSNFFTDQVLQNIVKIKKSKSRSKPYSLVFSLVATILVSFAVVFLYQYSYSSAKEQMVAVAFDLPIIEKKFIKLEAKESGALEWLSQVQENNGSWVDDEWGKKNQYTIGLTSLSLLAFASLDLNNKNEKYLNALKKATQFILSAQNENGSFGKNDEYKLYNQGIATVALFKTNYLIPGLVPTAALRKSINFINSCQKNSGGWSFHQNSEITNSSDSIYLIQSLQLAKENGFIDLDERINTNLIWVKSLIKENNKRCNPNTNIYLFDQNIIPVSSNIPLLNEHMLTDIAIEFKINFQKNLELIALEPEKKLNYFQFYLLTSYIKKLKEMHQFQLAQKIEVILTNKPSFVKQLSEDKNHNEYGKITGNRIYSAAMATISIAALN